MTLSSDMTSTTITADWVNETNQHVWNLTAKKQAPDELSSTVSQMGSKLDQFKISGLELQKTSQYMQSLQTSRNISFLENRPSNTLQKINNAKVRSCLSNLPFMKRLISNKRVIISNFSQKTINPLKNNWTLTLLLIRLPILY